LIFGAYFIGKNH